MNYLITVIIPVFNCEKYLEQSIHSLLKQSIFENIEFVFVDDGSTDNSYEIIKKFQKLNKNFILLHQENKGVSAARNAGIKIAHGNYISFFDADDIAMPGLYEKLYDLIYKNNADISIVDYSMIFSDGTEKKHRASVRKTWTNSKDAIIDLFSTNLICTNPIDKMFRMEIAKEIVYPEGYAIGEDMYYVYSALNKSNKVILDSTVSLYNYVLRPTSAMKQRFDEKHFDAVRLAEIIVNECEEDKEVFNFAYANYIHEICKMLELMYRSNSQKKYADTAKKYMSELRKYKLSYAKEYMSKKHFMALVLMRLSPSIYCIMYRILRIG